MKLNGIIGKGSGKLGSSVFAISGGEQVVREYNPVVSNPNTEAQIAQRAKLKLMSQLGAALAPAMLYVKQGLVSARNQFVSKNIELCSFADNEANCNLTKLQLTPSSVAFPGVDLSDGSGGIIDVQLLQAAAGDIKRVAYYVFKQTADNKLEYVQGKIVTEPDESRMFSTTFKVGAGTFVVYAYGIKDDNASATMKYEDYAAKVADADATLAVGALFRTSSYLPTKTSGAKITIV